MAERKVLNKYFPKNFDHEKIVKRGRGKDKLMIVRNMLPMSLRCNTCSNYLYIGTKFNMRMEICNDQVYLGIKVFRFYLKCTYCYADITFKTDPKNHDYIVETGGTRNYEPIKDAQQAEKLLKKMKVNEKEGDSMKYLQNKTYDSKREMQLTETLQEIKNLNKRQGFIDPEDLLKNIIYLEEQEEIVNEEEEQNIAREYEALREKIALKKFEQMQGSKLNGLGINNRGSYPTIKQESEDNHEGDTQKNQFNSEGRNNFSQKPYNSISEQSNKAKGISSISQKTETNGKKFILPQIKSKLDKYKKKIIKKDQKPEQANNTQRDVQSQGITTNNTN